jgi:hypothetical protein
MADQTPPLSKQALVDMIAAAAQALGLDRLPQKVFLKHSGLSGYAVDKHFDKWSDACRAAGIAQGRSLAEQPKKPRPTDEECIAELKRIAGLRRVKTLTSKEYDEYARIGSKTFFSEISSRWGEAENGRKRKYYSLKKDGKKALKRQREQWVTVSGVFKQWRTVVHAGIASVGKTSTACKVRADQKNAYTGGLLLK